MAKVKNTRINNEISNILDVITPSVLEFKKDSYTMGDAKMKAFSMFNYPPEAEIGWLLPLTRFNNCIVSYHIKEANIMELIENIERTINTEKLKSYESNSDIDKDEAAIVINRNRQLAQKIRSDDSKAVNLNIGVTVYGKDDEELDKESKYVKSVLEGNKFTLRPMNMLQKEGLFQNLPYCDNAYGPLTGIDMSMDTWAGSLGIFANQGLNDAGGSYFGKDISKEPIFFDIWSRKNGRNNSNLVVTGTSGAGKSTTAKNLMFNQFSKGDSLIVLDAEREYIGMAQECRGNIIEANGASDARINPLQMRDIPEAWDKFNTDEEIEQFILENKGKTDFQGALSLHISFLKTWFATYLPEMSMKHIALLEKSLYGTYKEKGIDEFADPRRMENDEFPIMENLYNFINNVIHTKEFEGAPINSDEEAIYKDLLTYLESSVHGTDRFLFNGPTTVDMNNAFTVFDVHKLLDAPENVKNAQFYNITTFCWLRLTRNRRERAILIVDEAHLFISKKHNQVFEWLSSSSRRFRKYEASLWLMTQNISDFLHDSIKEFGEPLLNNPDLKFCMRQRSTDLEKLRKLFSISQGEENKIEKAGRGEGLLMVGDIRLFASVEVAPKILNLIERTGGGR